MSPSLLKGLIGFGALGGLTAVSVGGYYLLSSSPKTIGDKFKGKTPVGPFMTGSYDAVNKAFWTEKMNSYKTGCSAEDEEILPKAGVTEKGLSDQCKDIIETSLHDGDLEKKETWAKKWCFKN